jgi:hypothetical protein
MRGFLVWICLPALAAIIVGCGAHSSYTVDTGGSGSLRGVRTVPADTADDVETDVHIRVYWVAGYEPPPEFTFRLRDDSGDSVLTVDRASNEPDEWIFEPWSALDYDTIYTIELTAGDSSRTFVFRTEEEPLFAIGSVDAPKMRSRKQGDTEPLPEHRVVTGH